MSVDPGGLESGSDPQDPVVDFDEESTLDDNELLDPIDESDDNNREASVYDTSWVPDDRPNHRTDYGDTLSEMREGESLDRRLAEDEPDLLDEELGDPVDQILGQRRDTEDDPDFEENRDARLATEADEDDADVRASLAEEGGDTDVPAPEFEEQQPRAGRLVAPDEGLESDTEKDMIAYDAGISGAGASAEEAAVHLTDEES